MVTTDQLPIKTWKHEGFHLKFSTQMLYTKCATLLKSIVMQYWFVSAIVLDSTLKQSHRLTQILIISHLLVVLLFSRYHVHAAPFTLLLFSLFFLFLGVISSPELLLVFASILDITAPLLDQQLTHDPNCSVYVDKIAIRK